MDKILELIPTGELGIIEFFFSTIFSLLSGYVVMIIYNIYFHITISLHRIYDPVMRINQKQKQYEFAKHLL